MKWSEFVVSDWFWAAGAVAVAVAALIGSLATFVGGAISRYRNRPEPEWHVTFQSPDSGTHMIWDGYVGNSVYGKAVNIGDGTAFQVRMVDPTGEPVSLTSEKHRVTVIPVVRTGGSFSFRIITNLGAWQGVDSVLSWVDPPTRRKKGGRFKVRPYKDHAEPDHVYRGTLGNVLTEEEWVAQGRGLVPIEG